MNATLNLCGSTYNVGISTSLYTNGATAVMATDMSDGSQFCVLSVNLPGASENLPEGCFYGKHWSENEGMLEQLVTQGIIAPYPEAPVQSSGFVSNIRAYRLLNK